MPFLPDLSPADPRSVADGSLRSIAFASRTDSIPFSEVSDHICLQCASPLSDQCGFSCAALRDVLTANVDTGESHRRWRIETLPCMCEKCDEAVASLASATNVDHAADRRSLLVDRHRFENLDALLGVDEPLETQRLHTLNRVPVLQLRSMILDDDAQAKRWPLSPLLRRCAPYLFCSFQRTVGWVAGNGTLQQHLFAELLPSPREEERWAKLFELYAIEWPADDVPDPFDGEHWYLVASYVRVLAALTIERAIRVDLRYNYDTDHDAQALVLACNLFANTHLHLHVTCDLLSLYDDVSLDSPLGKHLITVMPSSASEGDGGANGEMPLLLNEVVARRIIDFACPHPLRCAFVGELLDSSSGVVEANLWTDVQNGGRANGASQANSFIRVLMCKSLNHRCLLREFDVMLCREFGHYPVLIRFFMNLLEVFQLGAYPGPRVRPGWLARKLSHRTFHFDRFPIERWCSSCHRDVRTKCPHCGNRVPTREDREHRKHRCDVCRFVHSIKMQAFMAVKEFFVFTVRRNEIIDVFLTRRLGWREHADFIVMACNDVRRMLDQVAIDVKNGIAGNAALNRMRFHTELIHDVTKSCNTRLFKNPSLYEYDLAMLNRVATKLAVVPNWTGCQQPGDFLTAPLRREKIENLLVQHQHREKLGALLRCDVPQAHLGGARWCDRFTLEDIDGAAMVCSRVNELIVSVLGEIGMSPDGVSRVAEWHRNSDMRDMPDNNVEKLVTKFFREHPVDFHILHQLLRAIKVYSSVRVMALDAGTVRAQTRAVRLRNQLLSCQQLPADVANTYLCRHCGKLYDTVLEPPSTATLDDRRRLRNNASLGDGDVARLVPLSQAQGVPSAMYDVSRGVLMCNRHTDSSNAKRYDKADMLDEAMWIGDAGRAKSVRTARESARPCARFPLEYVRLLGRVLYFNGKAYTLCVVCGGVCHHSLEHMTNDGPTCGLHRRMTIQGTYKDLAQFVDQRTQQVRQVAARMKFPLRESLLYVPNAESVRPVSIAAAVPSADGEERVDSWNVHQARFGVRATPIVDGKALEIMNSARTADAAAAVAKLPRARSKRGSLLAIEQAQSTRLARLAGRRAGGSNIERLSSSVVYTTRRMTDILVDAGLRLPRVLVVCAACGKRCDPSAQFVRLTVDNTDNLLIDYIYRDPINNSGLVDVFLCNIDFNRAKPYLDRSPVPRCAEFFTFVLRERKSTKERVRNGQFTKKGS